MRILILLVAVVMATLLAACPKGGVKILGPKGPTVPGVYLNENWSRPLPVIDMLETKMEQREGLDINFNRETYEIKVIDIEGTFQLHPESIIHPDGEGKFNLYLYPGSTMNGFFGGLDTSTAEAFETNIRSSDGIQVLYIGEINLGSEREPIPVSKFSGYVTKKGRYLIDVAEGRLLVQW